MIARSKIVLLIALVLSVGISLGSGRMDPYHLDVVLGIGINIILAVSLNLINGYTGQFSLGHAGFMAVGGYSAAVLTTNFGAKLLPLLGGQTWALFLVALITGGVLAAVAGLLVGAPSLRLKGDYLAIVTLGFNQIIMVIIQNMDSIGGARGLIGIPSYTNFFWTFAAASITTYVVVTLVQSTYGRGFLAVHDDEIAAEAMGINTTRYTITAFVLGSFFAGIAGGLYAHFKNYISPDGFGFMRSIEIVVMVILGGMGNTVGVIIAAILLSLLPVVLREIPTAMIDFAIFGLQVKFSIVWRELIVIIYSLFIIVLMLARPQGLFSFRWKPKRRAEPAKAA